MPYGNSATGFASDLGLGGQLAGQVADETEEERKRRLAQLRQQQGPGQNTILGSSAAGDIFGGLATFAGPR